MYRPPDIYEEIRKTIIDIFLDYGIKEFPLEEKEICRKLGVALVPYSECPPEAQELLLKKSKHGFYVKGTKENPPTIYYNDQFGSSGAVRFTIFHDIKHYVYDEDIDDEEEDDLADFFARYFLCPIPYLLVKGMESVNEIVSHFGVSMEAAENVVSNLLGRKKKYGTKIFDYEIPLLELIDETAYQVFIKFHMDKGGD